MDGIIQQVFKQYRQVGIDAKLEITDKDINILLDRIRQELIEKIKEVAHTEELSNYPHLTLDELIGDNQEL